MFWTFILSLNLYSLPKYPADIRLLRNHHEFIQKQMAPDYWALSPFYIPQSNAASCSLSSVVIVLNAILADQKIHSDDTHFSSSSFLKKISDPHWTKRTREGGKGITLHDLTKHLSHALQTLQIRGWSVEDFNTFTSVSDFEKILQQNELSATDFLIVNFVQGLVTDDPEGMVGHLSPIGAYDAQLKRVLILDVDRDWYEPYWVPLEKLYRAVIAVDPETKKSRGLIRVFRTTV